MQNSKLTRYLEGESTTLNFIFYLPAAIIGAIAFLYGILELPTVFWGQRLSYAGMWSLMVLTFISSMLFTKQNEESNNWNQGFIVTARDKTLRTWIGVGLFAITFLNISDVSNIGQEFSKHLLQSFFVLGCYVLIIQATWGSFAQLEAERKATTKLSFDRYIVEVMTTTNNEWQQFKVVDDNLVKAIDLATALSSTEKYKDVRVIKESGYKGVIFPRSKLLDERSISIAKQ